MNEGGRDSKWYYLGWVIKTSILNDGQVDTVYPKM